MPRRPLITTNQFAYHITSRSNNKDWFYVSSELCWEIISESISKISINYQVHVFALVLMSNHFHLILETPFSNLGDVMRDFMTGISKGIQRPANRINHVFGARYKWSLLNSAFSVAYVLKYVFRNPVRAGLCGRVEDYKFSSLNLYSELPTVCGVGPLWKSVPKERTELLNWLNKPVAKELENQIALGLRRTEFTFSTDNNKQKDIRLLKSNYRVEPGKYDE
jgi:putative transposase